MPVVGEIGELILYLYQRSLPPHVHVRINRRDCGHVLINTVEHVPGPEQLTSNQMRRLLAWVESRRQQHLEAWELAINHLPFEKIS